ncbi:MAG: hypothetical protein QOA28_01875, partial [Nitrososphaeraceae archaeon]|nr:hypothetical protein [Nitrososphaeraceae archaeon]
MPELRIPGLSSLVGQAAAEKFDSGIILLMSPPGGGKTLFCRQMIIENLQNGSACIYINSSMTRKEYQNLFDTITDEKIDKLKFLNPYLVSTSNKESDPSDNIKSRRPSGLRKTMRH